MSYGSPVRPKSILHLHERALAAPGFVIDMRSVVQRISKQRACEQIRSLSLRRIDIQLSCAEINLFLLFKAKHRTSSATLSTFREE